jgi:hypothetical protein
MDNRTLNLDFYNNSYFVRSGNIQYAWFSLEDFLADTSFPYAEDIAMVTYEPGREMYIVAKAQQVFEDGLDSTTMQWIVNNFDRVLEIGRVKQLASIPVITMEFTRQSKLADADWLVQRHQEETLLNIPHKLTEAQYMAVLTYKQQLRDLTSTYDKDTPSADVTWPTNPIQ